SFESVEQAMTNYSMTLSDEQLEVVQTDISTAKKQLQTLNKHEGNINKDAITRLNAKYDTRTKEANNAIGEKNASDARRVAARIDGVLNDVHTMNKRAEEAYKQNQENTSDNVQWIITSALVAALTLIVIA
ncbi:UNVERIFIED_CONTAM: methyl-accepting chemotaxis protein, partial [Bacillus amyloliquefaciens DSM 7 = ATCC 23350]